MAITTGTVMPIRPYALNGAAGEGAILSFPITSAKVMQLGDVVIMTTGKVLDGNTAQAASVIEAAMADYQTHFGAGSKPA